MEARTAVVQPAAREFIIALHGTVEVRLPASTIIPALRRKARFRFQVRDHSVPLILLTPHSEALFSDTGPG